MSTKNIKRLILFAQYFPAIFLWVLVPQLAYIAGSGHRSAVNTFETLGLFGLWPIPVWVVIAALLISGIVASIREFPLAVRAVPAVVVASYGLTIAINFRSTDISSASMLGATYLIGCSVSFLIIWSLSPILLRMLQEQEKINEKVLSVSEHIIKLENRQDLGIRRTVNR